MTQTSASPSSEEPRIVVVGMGPGGIVSAIEAAKKGHKVLVVENRDHFTRSQRVKVDYTTIAYLEALNEEERKKGPLKKEDEDFIQSIMDAYSTVQIDQLQEFLARKLERLYSDKVEIRRGSQHQVENIDLKNQQIIVSNSGVQERIPYSHVVGADGARHAMADMVTKAVKKESKKGLNLFKNIGKKFGVKYKQLDTQTRQVAHGTVSFRAIDENAPLNPVRREFTKSDLPRLQALGWDEPYLPQVYMFPDGNPAKKMYVAGEIPQKILDEKDKKKQQEMLVKWGEGILALQYGIDLNQITFDVSGKQDEKSKQQDRLKATAFPVVLTYASHPCIRLPTHTDDPDKHSAFVLVGDANKSANFHLGHGANDAINDGIQFGRCLRTDSFGFDSYEQHQDKQKEHMVRLMEQAENKMASSYIARQKELNEEVKHEAGKLIASAKLLYPEDKALQKAARTCEKHLRAHPIDYDGVYLSTVALADKLNAKADKLYDKQEAKLNRKIASKEASIAFQETKKDIFDAISKISSKIGDHLQEKSTKTQKAIERKKAKLETLEEKRAVPKQQLISQPHQFLAYKQRLEAMSPEVKKAMDREAGIQRPEPKRPRKH